MPSFALSSSVVFFVLASVASFISFDLATVVFFVLTVSVFLAFILAASFLILAVFHSYNRFHTHKPRHIPSHKPRNYNTPTNSDHWLRREKMVKYLKPGGQNEEAQKIS